MYKMFCEFISLCKRFYVCRFVFTFFIFCNNFVGYKPILIILEEM